jgi:hypothetical protein
MDKEILVHVDLDGLTRLVGRLWTRARKNKESATVEYDSAWLEHSARFSLEPALKLGHADACCPRVPFGSGPRCLAGMACDQGTRDRQPSSANGARCRACG